MVENFRILKFTFRLIHSSSLKPLFVSPHLSPPHANPLSPQREPSSSSSSLPDISLPLFNFFFFFSNALEFLLFGLPATHPLLSRSNARRLPCERLRASRPCPASSVFIPLNLSVSFQTMSCYPRNVSV